MLRHQIELAASCTARSVKTLSGIHKVLDSLSLLQRAQSAIHSPDTRHLAIQMSLL